MPQGGGATTARVDDSSSDSLSSSQQLFRYIREGVSWSGNERNQCFLNAGFNQGFRDISAAAGFDFPDDGRGMVLTDWDGDGDLDALISNRNAPQLRFLLNQIPAVGNQSLGIHLTGNGQVNRDAIGARVTVELSNQPPLIRTLRAGEGFETQNSKWLHFGLGKSAKISRVAVRWPDGKEQVFSDIRPGGRYHITRGEKIAKMAPHRNVQWPSPLRPLELPEFVSGGQAKTASRLPVANLPYTTFDGKTAKLKPSQVGQITLVNLWASWCKPCLAEMKEFRESKSTLDQAGVQILALSLDGINNQPGSAKAAQDFMKRLGDPFSAGIATPQALEKITVLHNLVYEKRGTISLPTSILIDEQGQLAGYFEGPLNVERLLEHVVTARQTDPIDKLAGSLPFSGRWLAAPFGFRLTEYGNALLNKGFYRDAESLINRHYSAFKLDPGLPKLLVRLGDTYEKQGDLQTAVEQYRKAVELKPANAFAHASLGDKYSALKRYANAVAAYRSALKLDGTLVDTRYNLGIMLNRLGQDDAALAEFRKVIKTKPDHTMAIANIAAQMLKRKNLHEAIIYLRATLKTKPDFHAARFQLARLLEATSQPSEAIAEYETLLKLEPRFGPAKARLKELQKQAPDASRRPSAR